MYAKFHEVGKIRKVTQNSWQNSLKYAKKVGQIRENTQKKMIKNVGEISRSREK